VLRRGPAYCATHGFPAFAGGAAPLLSDQSLGGHVDFPRDCPLPMAGGFPRYEPVLGRLSRDGGASWCAYPTRNFATLGPFLLLLLGPRPERSAHFWPTLMVAHESGLSHLAPGRRNELGV
jgi:hypothetical protein